MLFEWMADRTTKFGRDVRLAWRSLRRSPVFLIATATLLAIGIGANTAVIGIIDAAFFRPLPVPQPNEMIGVFSRQTGPGHDPSLRPLSFADYLEIRTEVTGMSGLAAYQMESVPIQDSLGSRTVFTALVSDNYFKVFEVNAARGRALDESDWQRGQSGSAVVIGDALWKEDFGGSPSAINSHLKIGTREFTVVGVTPPGFTGTNPEGRTDMWVAYSNVVDALPALPSIKDRNARAAMLIGRLAPKHLLAEVQTSLTNVGRQLSMRYPSSDAGWSFIAVHHKHLAVLEESKGGLISMLLVWAMVLVMHLVACSNVAILIMARANQHRHELGVRLCLGASRGQIVRKELMEPALLAAIGAVIGTVIAYWLGQLLTSMEFLSAFQVGLDPRILMIVAVVTVLTTVQFGLWPAREAGRADPIGLLGGSSTGRVIGKRGSADRTMLTLQVALALVLTANAVVIVKLFDIQAKTPPGFDVNHLAVARINLGAGRHSKAEWLAAYEAATARVAAIPGVRGSSATMGVPLDHAGTIEPVIVAAHQYASSESKATVVQKIGPGYFATLGSRILAGREFDANDNAQQGPNVFDAAVVNQAMIRRYWPGKSPADVIGQRIRFSGSGEWAQVVGVVADIKDISASTNIPHVYVPLLESLYEPFEIVAHTSGTPDDILPNLRSAIMSVVPLNAHPTVFTMSKVHDDATMLTRTAGIALGVCAATALLLTAIGLYGLATGWAEARKAELGIRLALGASRMHVERLLMTDLFRILAIGSVAGVLLSAFIIRIEQGWWGPTVALHPTTIAITVVVLGLSAGVAAYVPARRAARANPVEALRSGN